MAVRSSEAIGGIGARPHARSIRNKSNPSVCNLCIAVSTHLATICTVPAGLAVLAISNVSQFGAMLHLTAMFLQTLSDGILFVSSTPTQTSGRSSRCPISSKSFSRPAATRMGPDPIAKKPSSLISHPAYCDAIHAASGCAVATPADSPDQTGESAEPSKIVTVPSPERQTSANRRPASIPPGAFTPQSMIRVPQASVLTVIPSESASRAMASQSSQARSLRVSIAPL